MKKITLLLTTIFLKELGFLSPRTSYIDVNINGVNEKMILQEKINKELNKVAEMCVIICRQSYAANLSY